MPKGASQLNQNLTFWPWNGSPGRTGGPSGCQLPVGIGKQSARKHVDDQLYLLKLLASIQSAKMLISLQ